MSARSRALPSRLGPARRLWDAVATPSGFRSLSLVALAGLWVIVPSGAFVRLTASGLGCPDWPLCNGGIVPAAAGHAWIEYSNRILSALVMAVSVFTWISSRRLAGRPVALRRWSGAIALATVGQVPLGAVTVAFDLHPLLVASHFLLSMIALGSGTVLALRANDHAGGVRRGWDLRLGPLAAVTAAALGTVLVTGVLVTAAGPHSGDAEQIRRFGRLDHAAFVHVRAVIALVVVALALVALTWRSGAADRLTKRMALALVPLLGVQIALGEYQYRHHLPWGVVVAHVSVAGLAWALGLATCWRVARPERAAELSPAAASARAADAPLPAGAPAAPPPPR